MRRLVVLALLLGLMTLLQTLQVGSDTAFNPLSLATFGFILLVAYTLGQLAANIQLPKITGYIVTGLVFGPQIFNIFSSAVEADLRVVNDLAIGLIALSAGAEMQLSGLKRIARSLFWIVALKGLLVLVAVAATVFALAPFIPFLSDQPISLVLSVGMILGVLAIGTSPAATIAVINETGAKGRLADTTLGVAVAKDIVMVVLLALGIALARTFSPGGEGFETAILGELGLELLLSLIAGVTLGGVIIGYIRFLGAELWLFVVGITFAMTAIATEFHLEALLVFIVAGFVVQNASSLGHDFVHLVEKVALPVFVVFFSVAGAGLDLTALRSVLLVALALVGVRLVAIFVGTAAATRIADEPEPIRRYAWLSFVSQAGVVIGLSIIVENSLPGLGAEIRTLVMGTVAINLLLGPVLFKLALTRAGEVPGHEIEADGLQDSEREEPQVVAGPLPAALVAPVTELEEQITSSLERLADVARAGPLAVAAVVQGWPAEDREQKEGTLATNWARDLTIAANRFWSEVNQVALAAPRQISVPLEEVWFKRGLFESATQQWARRLRRLRRALRRVGGSAPVLERTVPLRALALFHASHALAEDLGPALARIAAQPALTLRAGLDGWQEPEDVSGPTPEPPDPDELRDEDPIDALARVTAKRFDILRRELAVVGTVELRSGRRRASMLHERAQRARVRAGETIEAWDVYAHAVVEHEQRREAVEDLRVRLTADATAFESDLKAQFDAAVLEPIYRAQEVVETAVEAVGSLEGADSETIEESLIRIGETLSMDLRRRSLAGLRRGIEARPLNAVLRRFDDQIEDRLEVLPEGFKVVDPRDLPSPDEPYRAYPETASHQFRLIATGAVERTLRPTLSELRERAGVALEQAAQTVKEVRELIELRMDAAVDAAMDEGRADQRADPVAREIRESLHVAKGGLQKALWTLKTQRGTLEAVRGEALAMFHGDFEALSERLGGQLASAKPLEARLQAERARVELEGSAFLQIALTRLRRRALSVLRRVGLRGAQDRQRGDKSGPNRPPPLRPAGPAGSDRAVVFHVLFDDTTLAGKIFDGCLILTILASILVLMLESVEPLRLQNAGSFLVLEWLFTLLFTLEYGARLWAVDRPARYALSFFGIIDFLAVIPTYLSLVIPGGRYLMVIRVLRVVRAFRVFKLARYVGEAQVLVDAMKASRYKITVFLVYVVSAAVVVGSAMFLIEGPESGFTSIPRSVYWSIVTLTTVGFGDITPQSPLGQTLAAVLMILGYGIIAVPTGIVTAEIATSRSTGSGKSQTCPRCGHEEGEPEASYCLVCGASLA